jgi:hypothetical protein
MTAKEIANLMWPALQQGGKYSFGDRGYQYLQVPENDDYVLTTTPMNADAAKVGDIIAYDWNDTCDFYILPTQEDLEKFLHDNENLDGINSLDDLD